ncbi:MAG: AAA family ATPase [Candidatus Heimdallarchaeota archaeon]|nr:AAA family ATPase [Candidatus Heimdallarchaeota archaeon]
MRLLIGITGHMGSGKSFAADNIAQRFHCSKIRLSGKMREIAEELQIIPTRDFLQGIGKFMRDFDDDVWVKYVFNQIQSSELSVVIDDIRRANEISYLKPLGFKFIRLESDSSIRKKRIEKRGNIVISDLDWKRWAEHLTEIQVSELEVDAVIQNNGTEEELIEKLDAYIKGNRESQS